jgi:hypothetical protein
MIGKLTSRQIQIQIQSEIQWLQRSSGPFCVGFAKSRLGTWFHVSLTHYDIRQCPFHILITECYCRAFWELPNDLMAIIVSLLTKDEDRHNLHLVCKHWRCAVNENITRCEIESEMSWMSLVKPSVAYTIAQLRKPACTSFICMMVIPEMRSCVTMLKCCLSFLLPLCTG